MFLRKKILKYSSAKYYKKASKNSKKKKKMLMKGIKNFLKQRKAKDGNMVVKGYKNLPEVEKRGCLSRENNISKNKKTKLLHK